MSDEATNQQPTDEVTLEEFCIRASVTDRRVELLAAFHAVETKAGRHKGREAEYAARLADFANLPA